MRLTFSTLIISLLAFASPAFAMDGTNVDTGDLVTVDDGTIFKVGDTIPFYDTEGNELDAEIQAVNETDSAIDVDITDPDSGDTATIEFAK